MDDADLRRPSTPARAELVFARDGDGVSFLARQYAAYPFHLCKVHRYADDPPGMATMYLQSVSGGIFRHDDLALRLSAGAGAEAHVTTQAATIVHAMDEGEACQGVAIEADAGAFLEYLPDPMILFAGSRLRARLAIRADESAAVVAGDSFLLHDPANAGGMFDRLASEATIADPRGRVLVRDRFTISGRDLQERLPGLNGEYLAQGALYVVQRRRPQPEIVRALARALDGITGVYAGASALPGGCGAWARFLAADGAALKAATAAAWSAAREALTGRRPAVRRK